MISRENCGVCNDSYAGCENSCAISGDISTICDDSYSLSENVRISAAAKIVVGGFARGYNQ